MMDLFGIPNCNTVKKARDWLNDHGIEYTFHNFKKEPPTESQLTEWLNQTSWETLVNRAGMTWRKLTDEEKSAVNNNASAIALMIAKPSVIKRPVAINNNKIITIGYKEDAYEEAYK